MQWLSTVLIFACLFLNSKLRAQTYILSPGDTILQNGSMEDLHILGIMQNNNSQDTLFLSWKKLSAVHPEKWDAAVCDNVFCNTILADSGIMNPVAPGSFGFLEMHITPKINFGTAVIRYLVRDVKNPGTADTLTYILNLYGLSATDKKPYETKLLIKNSVLCSSDPQIRSIQIFDLKGLQLLSSTCNSIDMSSLGKGIYLILLTDFNASIHYQKIFYEID